MFGDGVLALRDGLQQRALSAAVLAEQAVATPKGQLQVGFVEEDAAVEGQAGADDLDVSAARDGSQDTGGDAVRQAVGIFLVGEPLDLVGILLTGRGQIVGIRGRVVAGGRAGGAGVLGSRLGASLGPRDESLLLALALGRLLGESLLLGRRDHLGGGEHVWCPSGRDASDAAKEANDSQRRK